MAAQAWPAWQPGLAGAQADGVQQRFCSPILIGPPVPRTSWVTQSWPPPQPAEVPGVQPGASVQAATLQHCPPLPPPWQNCPLALAMNSDEVVMAMWKS